MKSTNRSSIHPRHLKNAQALQRAKAAASASAASHPGAIHAAPPPEVSTIRTTGREYVNPVDYQHPFDSLARFAKALALRYDANRTRHAYYRQLRLLHEHFACDPATLTEEQLRDYFVFIKLKKHWMPKSIRQAVAATRMFFIDLIGRSDWTVFWQIRTKDHDTLPAVLTRRQVHDLLSIIRLHRYRTPIKLIYACGLRLSECLALTIYDIKGAECCNNGVASKFLTTCGRCARRLRLFLCVDLARRQYPSRESGLPRTTEPLHPFVNDLDATPLTTYRFLLGPFFNAIGKDPL
jgi:hypothetical protein